MEHQPQPQERSIASLNDSGEPSTSAAARHDDSLEVLFAGLGDGTCPQGEFPLLELLTLLPVMAFIWANLDATSRYSLLATCRGVRELAHGHFISKVRNRLPALELDEPFDHESYTYGVLSQLRSALQRYQMVSEVQIDCPTFNQKNCALLVSAVAEALPPCGVLRRLTINMPRFPCNRDANAFFSALAQIAPRPADGTDPASTAPDAARNSMADIELVINGLPLRSGINGPINDGNEYEGNDDEANDGPVPEYKFLGVSDDVTLNGLLPLPNLVELGMDLGRHTRPEVFAAIAMLPRLRRLELLYSDLPTARQIHALLAPRADAASGASAGGRDGGGSNGNNGSGNDDEHVGSLSPALACLQELKVVCLDERYFECDNHENLDEDNLGNAHGTPGAGCRCAALAWGLAAPANGTDSASGGASAPGGDGGGGGAAPHLQTLTVDFGHNNMHLLHEMQQRRVWEALPKLKHLELGHLELDEWDASAVPEAFAAVPERVTIADLHLEHVGQEAMVLLASALPRMRCQIRHVLVYIPSKPVPDLVKLAKKLVQLLVSEPAKCLGRLGLAQIGIYHNGVSGSPAWKKCVHELMREVKAAPHLAGITVDMS